MSTKEKGRTRANGEGSWRKRGKTVQFRWNGKTLSEPIAGRTDKQLRSRLTDLIGQPIKYSIKETLEDVAREWFAAREKRVNATVRRIEESTYATDGYALEMICRMFPGKALVDILPNDIDQKIPEMTYEDVRTKKDGTVTKTTKPYSLSRQQHAKSMLKQIFAYAVSTGRIKPADNPMLLVQPLTNNARAIAAEKGETTRKAEPDNYSIEEICDLLERLPDNKFGHVYIVDVGCGFRGQEMRARRDTDIEPDGSVIDINNAVKRGHKGRDYIGLTKSEAGDRLDAVPEFAQPSARWLREHAINGYIMPNKSGGHISYSTYRQGITDALKKAGVRPLPPHKARNTYITAMRFEVKEDPRIIMANTGHADRETMEGYAGVSFDDKQASAAKLNAVVMARKAMR